MCQIGGITTNSIFLIDLTFCNTNRTRRSIAPWMLQQSTRKGILLGVRTRFRSSRSTALIITTSSVKCCVASLTFANNSCCCLRSSSSGMPRFSKRELAFLLFSATVLHSCKTSFTSLIQEPKPKLSSARKKKKNYLLESF